MTANAFRIAVLPGDGIGIEVMDAALRVLAALAERHGGPALDFEILPGGAAHYRDHGTDLPDESVAAAESADAILFGAMGLPDVRKADGTEINPQLDLRFRLDLYAGVRPVRVFQGVPSPLADARAADIDFVIVRENTEGLFADVRDPRPPEDSDHASDRCVITRAGTARVVDFAFRLAATRHRARPRRHRVTCVDKANVLKSMAFFRQVFDDVRAHHPSCEADHAYVDAMALNLVKRPWEFDVLVMENLFGDILSDLAAGLVGGLGMAPSGDIGGAHALFQPSHGSAPDIAGKGIANPTAMFLSAAMMLRWLGERHGEDTATAAAVHLEDAISKAFSRGTLRPVEAGGSDGTRQITRAVLNEI